MSWNISFGRKNTDSPKSQPFSSAFSALLDSRKFSGFRSLQVAHTVCVTALQYAGCQCMVS